LNGIEQFLVGSNALLIERQQTWRTEITPLRSTPLEEGVDSLLVGCRREIPPRARRMQEFDDDDDDD